MDVKSHRLLWLACALLTLTATVGCSGPAPIDTPPATSWATDASMPAFTGPFAKMAEDFYKIKWTRDGYPARDDGFEHPLYPIYVLDNYLAQYDENPSAELEEAIRSVAYVAVERMDDHQGALVFWYEPGKGARLYDRHYSALTQGYYSNRLYHAGTLLDDPSLIEAARRSFEALLVTVEDGGVLSRDRNGVSLAEVPQQPNSYILNGWQSALASAWDYWQASGDTRARDLVLESTKAMADLLPRYDAAELSNSRYGLTGFTYLRTTSADLDDLVLKVPGEGEFRFVDTRKPSRWQLHRVSERQANVVLSLASQPDHNVITIKVTKPTTVEIQVGRYDPLTSSPVDLEWVHVGTVTPSSPDVVVPWSLVERVVYPTNFVKKIEGHQTNVYHSIHVQRLGELAEATGIAELDHWANEWTDAMNNWGGMDIYRGLYARPVPGGHRPGVEVTTLPVDQLSRP